MQNIIIKSFRNTYNQIFNVCRYKFYLSMLYSPREVNKPMVIGSAIHAALSVWSTKGKTQDEAFEAIFSYFRENISDIETREECENEAIELLTGYFSHWKEPSDRILTFAEEKEFCLRFTPLLQPYEGRRDGIFRRKEDKKIYVLERKTTGSYANGFLDNIEHSPQLQAYSHATVTEVGEEQFGGVLVDVLQKQTKRHGMDFKARYFTYDKKKIAEWKRETIDLCSDIHDACVNGKFYKNKNICKMYYGKCEFYEYCTTGNIDVLHTTHKEEMKKEVAIRE